MKSARSTAVLAILLAGVTGCSHKQPPPPPPPPATAPLPPTSMTQLPSLPQTVPAPEKPTVGAPGSEPKPAAQPEPAQKVAHRTRPPRPHKTTTATTEAASTSSAATTSGAPPATAVQAPSTTVPAPAATTAPPATAPDEAEKALGQLSAGGGADKSQQQSMDANIHSLEARLTAIKRPLSKDEQNTVDQIRVFLAKAKQAVVDNDLDGARTLTTKARLLLDELTSS